MRSSPARVDSSSRGASRLARYRGTFFFSSRRRHTRFDCDWSSDVCSSDLGVARARGLGTAWAARAGVGVVSAALATGHEPAEPAPIAAVLAEWREMARAGGDRKSVV